MATCKGISKLLSQSINILLARYSHFPFLMELSLEQQILLVADRLGVFGDEVAQYVELLLKLLVLRTFDIGLLLESISFDLERFNFFQKLIDPVGSVDRILVTLSYYGWRNVNVRWWFEW